MSKIIAFALLFSLQTFAEEPKFDGITDSEFLDFSNAQVDDKVVQFRRGSDVYTMIPMRDWWFTDKRRDAFDAAQAFSQKLMTTWLAKAFSIQMNDLNDPNELLQKELEKRTAEELRDLLSRSDKLEKMPTARDLINQTQSARQAAEKLTDRAKFLLSFDELITTFDKNQDEILEFSGAESLKERLTPSAFMFVLGAKVPYELVKFIEGVKYIGGLAPLLRGSLTMSLTVRPWFVTKINLNTGEKTEQWYFESASQVWIFKDLGSKRQIWNGHYRYGAGLLWGDFAKMGDISGFTVGGSYNFNIRSVNDRNQDGFLPFYYNIKFGTVTAAAQTLTQVMDIGQFLKHGYFMVSKQSGIQAPIGKNKNAEIGYAANIRSITDKITIDQDTLDELTKEITDVIPGAQVTVRNNKIGITVPVDSQTVLKSPAKNSNPQDLQDPGTESPSDKTNPPKHDR